LSNQLNAVVVVVRTLR